MSEALTEGAAVLIVVLVGFLPTEIWRSLAVMAGRRVEEGSELFHWVRAVAGALLAAVVARLLLSPAGALLAIPLLVRLGAVGGGVAVFLLARKSVLAGVLAGEALLLGAAFWFDVF
ncbi:AzlD domain-containing protein [Xanthobacter sp. TB0139]|uniref:AzlD domain-containing protein n=1 Tax=Xanthobacter sp. TB0139 TaxID=3459178 RepID=UPI004039DB71